MINTYRDSLYSTKAKFENGKLCTYFKLKQYFGFENYLAEIINFELRKSIINLRISAHKLMIEMGRYSNVPINERFCNKCQVNAVGDETHFLIVCENFSNDRKVLFELVKNEVSNFKFSDNEQKIIYLLTSQNQKILSAVGQFICSNV